VRTVDKWPEEEEEEEEEEEASKAVGVTRARPVDPTKWKWNLPAEKAASG
jgi:hypothetical protein